MSQLTLLCVTYNRHKYLKRSIDYWSKFEFDLIYIDGSDIPIDCDLSRLDAIRYYHMKGSYQERIAFALGKIKTQYVAMLCDDEFYIPSSLHSCIRFLDNNPDYVSCLGRAIGFSARAGKVLFSDQYPRLRDRNLTPAASFERLIDHFSSYVPAHYYAVTRLEVFIRSMNTSLNISLDVYSVFELAEEFLIVSGGKSCVLPELYWLRSHEVPPIRNTGDVSLDPSKRFDHWWLSQDPHIAAERYAFCSELALSTNSAVTRQEVIKIFDSFVKNSSSKSSAFGVSMRDAIKKLTKLIVPGLIFDRLKKFSDFGNRFLPTLKAFTVHYHFSFQDLRDQGVMIDESGLAQCVAAIEASLSS